MNTRKTSNRRNTGNKVVFLFDVDNTLLDNDQVIEDLREYLRKRVGQKKCGRYWSIFEKLREEVGYADYLGALQRYRIEHPHDMHLLAVSQYLIDYPFANRLLPKSLDALSHVRRWGPTVLLTDGDVVFQPHKIQRSGLDQVVAGRVLIYVHKERELRDVQAHFPADHYVMLDDKLRVLTAIKKAWRSRVTTVFVKQGHYARDHKIISSCPPADLDIENIGDLVKYDRAALLQASKAGMGLAK